MHALVQPLLCRWQCTAWEDCTAKCARRGREAQVEEQEHGRAKEQGGEAEAAGDKGEGGKPSRNKEAISFSSVLNPFFFLPVHVQGNRHSRFHAFDFPFPPTPFATFLRCSTFSITRLMSIVNAPAPLAGPRRTMSEFTEIQAYAAPATSCTAGHSVRRARTDVATRAVAAHVVEPLAPGCASPSSAPAPSAPSP